MELELLLKQGKLKLFKFYSSFPKLSNVSFTTLIRDIRIQPEISSLSHCINQLFNNNILSILKNLDDHFSIPSIVKIFPRLEPSRLASFDSLSPAKIIIFLVLIVLF